MLCIVHLAIKQILNEKFPNEEPFVSLQDSYIQSRADTMQNIEQTIVELGSIFQQLATMVKEQEEMVQRYVKKFILTSLVPSRLDKCYGVSVGP